MERRRILHCITNLAPDGAQQMLRKVVSRLEAEGFENRIVSLRDGGSLLPAISELGIPVCSLGMKRGMPSLSALVCLSRIVDGFRPSVLQGWMYHANLALSLAQMIPRRKRCTAPIAWNIRQSLYDIKKERLNTRAVISLSARLSGRPDAIIYCAAISAEQHEALGFDPSRRVVIANGFDTDRFAPSSDAYRSLREDLGLDAEARIVGNVGRYHPQKDHETFCRAAVRTLQRFPEVHFVLVGSGLTRENSEVSAMIDSFGLGNRIHLLGECADMPRIVAGFDVFCLTSAYGEGFPNVLGEALACGVTCVATDIGASREILEGVGRIALPRDPASVSAEMDVLLSLSSADLKSAGLRCRERVLQRFSLQGIARNYGELYLKLMQRDSCVSWAC